jgi:lipopolysaccharide export system permease protein
VRIIERYLAGAVIGGTAVTLAVLVPLLGVILLADDLESIGTADYGLTEAVLVMALRLPRYAYQLFPIATLIGALIGLGTLASRSELVALRAAGVSVWQIVRAGLLGGAVLALVAVLLGEVIAPLTEQHGAALRREALSTAATPLPSDGFWAVAAGAYVNIRAIRAGTELSDISIYQVDTTAGTVLVTHAAAAQYQDGRWQLTDVARSRVSAAGVTVERSARAEWTSELEPALLKIVSADPQLLPVWALYRYIQFMTLNQQDASRYAVVFWGKVVHPLLTLSMILLATPLLLGSSRSTGMGRRLFIGILVGILYYLMSRTLAYLALLFGMNPFLAAIVPPLLFIAGAVVLLKRIN